MQPKVIACIDDSPYAESVCDYAAWSAQRLSAPLCLLHVLDEPHGEGHQNLSGSIGFDAQDALLAELVSLDEQRAKIAMEQGKHLLYAAKERVSPGALQMVETRQRHGTLLSALSDLDNETRMVVVGKRGAETSSAHGHIGGQVESLIRTAHKPVLIAQQRFSSPQKIMFAFDGSATAHKGVEMLASSPLFRGLPCHLVTAGPQTNENLLHLETAQNILTMAGFETFTAIIPGPPEKALADYQYKENIDLMIMGAYGHSRIRQLILGSTTTAMIATTQISLMVLR